MINMDEDYEHHLCEINKSNFYQMKILVENCFPLCYSDKFFVKVYQKYQNYSRFFTLKGLIVGGVVGRIEILEETSEEVFHLLILLVLPKYRRKKIAKKLMFFIERQLKALNPSIKCIELHVQKINTAAVSFYQSIGFTIVEEKEEYYDNLPDPAALYMRKILN